MGTRIIPCQVCDEYIKGAGVVVGAAGSHHDVVLELAFSPLWEGLAKTITWFDALGEHPTLMVLGTDLLAPGELEVYRVPVPPEAKAVAGEMELTIKGAAVADGVEIRATVAATARFRVLPGKWDPDAEESQDVTPSQAEQIQAQIEAIKPKFASAAQDAASAAASAAGAAASQEAAQASEEAAKASQAAAAASQEEAQDSAEDSEAWAVGWRGGRDVGPEDPAYQNNARWYKDQAQSIVGGDYATRPQAQGYVDAHDQNPEAHQDIRAALDTRVWVSVGAAEPETGPVLWFNTAGAAPTETVLLELGGEDGDTVLADVDGELYGVNNATANEEPATAGVYDFHIEA